MQFLTLLTPLFSLFKPVSAATALTSCPCCQTPGIIGRQGNWTRCRICKWVDDPLSRVEPDMIGYPNKITRNQAIALWNLKHPQQPQLPCPCCSSPNVITRAGNWHKCEHCGWIDDPTTHADPTYVGPPNRMSRASCLEKHLGRIDS